MQFIEKANKLKFIGCAIFSLSLLIRLFTATRESLHIDEYAQANTYYLTFSQMFASAFSWGRHPPLDFIIGWFAVRIFPYSDILVRTPSIIFGALTSYYLFKILCETTQKLTISFFGSLAATIWFPAIFYSQYVRPYAIFTFLFGIALYKLIRFKGEGELPIALILLCTLLPWSRGADGSIASILISATLLVNPKSRTNHKSLLTILVLASNYIVYKLMNASNHSVIFSDKSFSIDQIPKTLWRWIELLGNGSIFLKYLILISTLIIIFFFRKIPHKTRVVLAITFIHSLTSFYFISTFSNQGVYSRYQVISIFYIFIVISVAADTILQIIGKRKMAIMGAIVVIGVTQNTLMHLNSVKNYSFNDINSQIEHDKKNHYVAAFISTGNQYLPGWPKTQKDKINIQEIPLWIPSYALSKDNYIPKLILLSQPNLDFFPKNTDIHEYGTEAQRKSNFIVISSKNEIIKTLTRLSNNVINPWYPLALIKIASINKDYSSIQLGKKLFCDNAYNNFVVDMGNNFGDWGKNLVLQDLLKNSDRNVDCTIIRQ